MTTTVATVVVELVAVVPATLALPSPHLGSGAGIPPAILIQRSALGTVGGRLLLVGVAAAMFDTGLAATLGYGRIITPSPAIASGRNLSRFFLVLNRKGVRYRPYLILGAVNLLIVVFSVLTNLVVFTGALLLVLYLGVMVT